MRWLFFGFAMKFLEVGMRWPEAAESTSWMPESAWLLNPADSSEVRAYAAHT